MNSIDLTPTSFLYVASDIPSGQTLADWRRERDAARAGERRPRRNFRFAHLPFPRFVWWTP